MLLDSFNRQATKAEIGFELFPCGSCATEADSLLRSLDGVIQILFDPAVQRVAVFFDPTKIDIPRILLTLEPFGLRPKVVSVITGLNKGN